MGCTGDNPCLSTGLRKPLQWFDREKMGRKGMPKASIHGT